MLRRTSRAPYKPTAGEFRIGVNIESSKSSGKIEDKIKIAGAELFNLVGTMNKTGVNIGESKLVNDETNRLMKLAQDQIEAGVLLAVKAADKASSYFILSQQKGGSNGS